MLDPDLKVKRDLPEAHAEEGRRSYAAGIAKDYRDRQPLENDNNSRHCVAAMYPLLFGIPLGAANMPPN